ncbi:MAG: SMI1/KNR4 family protein [Bryobacterales bacterium]|jgi:hypothetical protein|nr:SMI1/KNR4 family protein [Bryobacterales bacterium]
MNAEIDHVISDIALYDPGFPSAIRGASPEEIRALENAAGASLPDVYREFLLRMGRRHDFLILGDADFSIGAVTAYYEHGLRPPPGFWLIGRAKGDPYIDTYLHSRAGQNSRIVAFPAPPASGFEQFARTHLRFLAGSLPQWIALSALELLRFDAFPAAELLAGARGNARALGPCEQALASVGLRPLWFSNDWVRVYEGPDGMAVATEYPGGRLIVDLRAADEAALRRYTAAVSSLLA